MLLAGSVQPWQQAVVHLLLAVTCGVAIARSRHALAQSGRAVRLAQAGLLLVAAGMTGLLVLPAIVLRFAVPGTVAAREGFTWMPVSLDPEATVSRLFLWVAAVTVMLCVGVWSTARHRRSAAEQALVVGVGGLAAIAGGHALFGAQAVFGILEVVSPPPVFFAPLVDPNHLGTLLILALPVAVGQARDHWPKTAGAVGAMSSAVMLTVLVAIDSPGVLFATLAVVVVAAGTAMPSKRRVALAGEFAAVTAVAFAVWSRVSPQWVADSVRPRVLQYADQPALIASHWLLGVGAGAYGEAYRPFRSIPTFQRYDHAHSDPVEWVVQTGLVGLVALAVAVWWARLDREVTEPTRAWRWTLGLLGVAVHSCLDFPLQVHGVLLVVAAAVAVRVVAYAPRAEASPSRVRRWLGALLVLQLAAAAWALRTDVVWRAAVEVQSFPTDRAGADRGARVLRVLGPWRPELGLHAAWSAWADGDSEGAAAASLRLGVRHPHQADTLRRAALVLLAVDRPQDARRLVDRALIRDPNDFRTWVVLSRLERPTDEVAAALALAEAMRHWPWDQAREGEALRDGLEMLPVALWWVDTLATVPAVWSVWLGDLLVERGEGVEALMAYEQAAALNPVYQDLPARARALALVGRRGEAETLLLDLIDRHPSEPQHRYVLADLLASSGRYAEASEKYLQVLTMDPRYVSARVGAIRTAALAGGPEAGLVVFRRLEIARQVDATSRLEAAQLEHDLGRDSACIRHIDDYRLSTDRDVGDRATALRQVCLQACAVCRDVTRTP